MILAEITSELVKLTGFNALEGMRELRKMIGEKGCVQALREYKARLKAQLDHARDTRWNK